MESSQRGHGGIDAGAEGFIRQLGKPHAGAESGGAATAEDYEPRQVTGFNTRNLRDRTPILKVLLI